MVSKKKSARCFFSVVLGLSVAAALASLTVVGWASVYSQAVHGYCFRLPKPSFIKYTDYCYDAVLEAGHKLSDNDEIIMAVRDFYSFYRVFDQSHSAKEKRGKGLFHFGWGLLMLPMQIEKEKVIILSDPTLSEIKRKVALNRIGSQYTGIAPLPYFQMSADLGFAPAMNNLGQMYAFGIGTDVDKEKAFEWYLRAAKAGNPVAMANVRIAYAKGEGVPQDAAEAEKWKRLSLRNTNETDLAYPTLERTLLYGNPITPEQAKQFRAAAQKGEMVYFDVTPDGAAAFINSFN